MYSSLISRARLAAVLITCSSGREVSGALAVAPRVCGSFRCSAAASVSTWSRFAPAASSSGRAVPSACCSSAVSRWTGSTWGLPSEAAWRIAADSASWLFRVSLSSMG